MTTTILACVLCIAQADTGARRPYVESSALAPLSESARENRAACGPLAVWYTLNRLGHQSNSDTLIDAARLEKHGTSIRRLLELLSANDCPARAISTSRNRLALLPVPSILIVDRGTHCVVYDGCDADQRTAKIFEPTDQKVRWVDMDRLRGEWTGEALIFAQPRPSTAAFVGVVVFVTCCLTAPVACLALQRRRQFARTSRDGFTLTELSVALGICCILLAILLPAIQHAREASRAAHCRNNLHQIGVGLHNYELAHHVFPPAVVWKPAGEPLGQSIAAPGSIDRVSLGIATPHDPDRVYANWAICLLPAIGESELYGAFDLAAPLGDPLNNRARAIELAVMKCPTDPANGSDNHFQRSGLAAADEGYARGNYAINGGTNRRCLMRLSRRKFKCSEGMSVNGTDLRQDTSEVWGNGVAGVNRAMRVTDFHAGLSKTIAVEEVRAGVHPLDRRGVWALGFAGSSITACHGLYGNNGPNVGKDAIQGCTQIVAHVPGLEALGMPCLQSKTDPRLEISERATARSAHAGGVNVLMADGSVHFVTDAIDRRTWHNLHDRSHTAPTEL